MNPMAEIYVGGLVSLVIVIAVVGVLVWALVNYVPMPAPFKNLIIVVAVLVLVLVVLNAFGIVGTGYPVIR